MWESFHSTPIDWNFHCWALKKKFNILWNTNENLSCSFKLYLPWKLFFSLFFFIQQNKFFFCAVWIPKKHKMHAYKKVMSEKKKNHLFIYKQWRGVRESEKEQNCIIWPLAGAVNIRKQHFHAIKALWMREREKKKLLKGITFFTCLKFFFVFSIFRDKNWFFLLSFVCNWKFHVFLTFFVYPPNSNWLLISP